MPLFVASYDENGKFIGVEIIKATAAEVDAAEGADKVSVIWLDNNAAPKAEAFNVEF